MYYDDWYKKYLDVYKTGLKPKTRESYDLIHREYISPVLGSLQLQEISPEDVQCALLAAGARGSRQAQLTYTLMHAVLRRAVRSRLIAWSPVDAIDRPAHDAELGAALTDADYAAALPALLEDLPLALAALAGLRRGELAGLQWGDIDLHAGLIHVRRTRIRTGGALIVQLPKSVAGVRDVPILPPLLQLLRRCYQLRPHAWVIDCAPETISHRWQRLQRDLQLSQPYRLHDLRHTYITRLLIAGCNPRIAQYLAGHASLDMTLRVYTHITADAAQREISRLAQSLQ